MSTRERKREERPVANGGGSSSGGGEDASLHAAAEHFLRLADRAIDRALSGDSEAFLRANRQQGGQ